MTIPSHFILQPPILLALAAVAWTILFLLFRQKRSAAAKAATFTDLNPLEAFRNPVVPSSARWLCAMAPGGANGEVAYRLRGKNHASGVKALAWRHWLEVGGGVNGDAELRLKRELLLNRGPDMRSDLFQALPESCAAQQEVLEEVLEWLLEFHGDEYSVGGVGGRVITVASSGESFDMDDAVFKTSPLVLASILVQEDFVILQPLRAGGSGGGGSGSGGSGSGVGSSGGDGSGGGEKKEGETVKAEPDRHAFVAGCCCFSFTEMGLKGERGFMRLGNVLDQVRVKGCVYVCCKSVVRVYVCIYVNMMCVKNTPADPSYFNPITPPPSPDAPKDPRPRSGLQVTSPAADG
jgi:hypothetical protein